MSATILSFPSGVTVHDFGVSESGMPWGEDRVSELGYPSAASESRHPVVSTPSVQCAGQERLDTYSAGESSPSEARPGHLPRLAGSVSAEPVLSRWKDTVRFAAQGAMRPSGLEVAGEFVDQGGAQ